MTSRRTVIIVGVLGVVLALIAASRTWVSGTLNDAVLQGTRVNVSGGKAAPTLIAGALVGAAAFLAILTTGRVARRIAAVLAVLGGLLCATGVVMVISDPSAPLRDQASAATGRTGAVGVDATLNGWPWLALIGGVLITVAGLASLLLAGRWSGLGRSYDAPAAPRAKDDWDALSEGDDPTAAGETQP
ncbi:Trp biosynthesis-associated membrane protein [Calidifontibacter sp. DB0510]|uniref:Trp biosynthesis-associated membrane protein n=1 Tax=Metallococcus carri TaxID=1656884 RepID=A0A967AYY0_9MICO|nr:Trp biosynthesis-associated membrane protein [Metallococcus carri]NHN54982.1 Trp biosynthesis-associated membrane protein [Metallococcus carri]NOP37328.1 Trp biosynthesis-associated membrane protein [Calidifontibacter sp. DB2511S]